MGDKPFKILGWNIGFASPNSKKECERIEGILKLICCKEPDVVVFAEAGSICAKKHPGTKIKEKLEAKGYTLYRQMSAGCKWSASVHIFVKKGEVYTVKATADLNNVGEPNFLYNRWLEMTVETKIKDFKLTILGVYVISVGGGGEKRISKRKCHWEKIICFAEAKKNENALIIGDFNEALACDTKPDADGRQKPTYNPEYLGKLDERGWTADRDDCNFATFENGSRLDYAFISPKLRKDFDITTRHIHCVRKNGISDHSAIIVKIRPKSTGGTA